MERVPFAERLKWVLAVGAGRKWAVGQINCGQMQSSGTDFFFHLFSGRGCLCDAYNSVSREGVALDQGSIAFVVGYTRYACAAVSSQRRNGFVDAASHDAGKRRGCL